MDTPQISIVIPVYNTGTFLDKCLFSVLNQTYNNLEIVVVNNGSTDNSEDIIKKYLQQDARIKFYSIDHVPTGCESRNVAFLKSSNDWVVPIDSDDYIENTYVEKLCKRLLETNADFIGGKMIGTDIKTGKSIFSIPDDIFDLDNVIDGKQAVCYTIGEWKINANGALINKRILPCYIRKDPKPQYNDEYETREMLLNARIVAFSNAAYYYLLNPNSTGKKMSFSKLMYLPTTHLGLVRLLRNQFGADSVEFKKEQHVVRSILIHSYNDYIKIKNNLSSKETNEYKRLLSELFVEFDNNIFNPKDIIATLSYYTIKYL